MPSSNSNMPHPYYIWFNINFTKLYVSNKSRLNARHFGKEIIKDVRLIVPSYSTKNEELVAFNNLYNHSKTTLKDTIYNNFIGMTWLEFSNPITNPLFSEIYEYTLIFDSAKSIHNVGGRGVIIEGGLSMSSINEILEIEITQLETYIFYKVTEKDVCPTKHLTRVCIDYICGLFIKELFY